MHLSFYLLFFSRRMGLALSLVSDVKEKVTSMSIFHNVELIHLTTRLFKSIFWGVVLNGT